MNGLIQLRKRLGLSQSELGAALGVGQSAILQCERNVCFMSPELAMKLVSMARARGFSTSLDELYETADRREPDGPSVAGD